MGLWLSPLGGWTKDDDVPLDVRMDQHHAIIKNGVFGDTEVVLAIFPSPMLYAGPREVQWHGQTMLQLNPVLSKKLQLLPFKFASYDKVAGKMAFFDPARKDDFVSISGTKMRGMARDGKTPPDGFMDPEG